jgi:hypothetical protein
MIRVSKLSAIAQRSSVGIAFLALASLFPAAGLTQSTQGMTSSLLVNQPVTNPGVSGQNFPSAIAQTSSEQPVTNPGISGQNAPASTIPYTSSPAVPTGDQPVTNPGISGQNAPASTIPYTSSPAAPTGDQPVTNPGVSGQNAPASTISPASSPVTPSPSGTTNPPNVIERTIIQRDDVLIPGNQAPIQPRTNRPAPAQTPNRPTAPAPTVPTQPLPQTTGFIRTAIASQSSNTAPGLDAQLLQATCTQNWRGAIAIVDRALAAAPTNQGLYRSQLRQYRSRLESLDTAGTSIPNWSQRCTGS